MLVFRLAYLLLITLAVGCTQVPEISSAQAQQSATLETAWVLTDTGVGGINKETAFEQAIIETALPGLTLSPQQAHNEDQAYSVLQADKGTETVLRVNANVDGKSIYSILISSAAINNSLGHTLGSQLDTIYNTANDCLPLQEQYAGLVSCRAPGSKYIYYIFSGDWQGPDGVLPPWDSLRNWTMTYMLWRPD